MKKFVLASMLSMIAGAAQASWTLDSAASKLEFVSVKKETVVETHHFSALSGAIDDKGKATLAIDLNSVNTNIDIRNERMKTVLFDTANYPTAKVKTKVQLSGLQAMKAGESYEQPLYAKMKLHGVAQQLLANVRVTKVSDTVIEVSTIEPITINSADYGLDTGIEQLKTIAKLPSIKLTVPVSFTLRYSAN